MPDAVSAAWMMQQALERLSIEGVLHDGGKAVPSRAAKAQAHIALDYARSLSLAPPAGSCWNDPIPGHVCTDCPPERIEATLGPERIEEAVRNQYPQKLDTAALTMVGMTPEQWDRTYETAFSFSRQTPLNAGEILGASKMHGARNLLARAKGLLQQAKESDDFDRHVGQHGRSEHMLSQVRSILHRGGLDFEDFSSADRQAILDHCAALLEEE